MSLASALFMMGYNLNLDMESKDAELDPPYRRALHNG